MKRLLRDLGLILVLAAFWAISGYTIGPAIEFFIELFAPTPYLFSVILASLNVILGMLLFKGITRDPTAERIFFEGPAHDDESDVRIGCLWGLPFGLLLYGVALGFAVMAIRFFTK